MYGAGGGMRSRSLNSSEKLGELKMGFGGEPNVAGSGCRRGSDPTGGGATTASLVLIMLYLCVVLLVILGLALCCNSFSFSSSSLLLWG